MAKKDNSNKGAKVATKLPLHKFIATGGKPKDYKKNGKKK